LILKRDGSKADESNGLPNAGGPEVRTSEKPSNVSASILVELDSRIKKRKKKRRSFIKMIERGAKGGKKIAPAFVYELRNQKLSAKTWGKGKTH